MIEKQDFYHGAALARLVEDDRCASVTRSSGGYLVNGAYYVLVKYSTRGRSPWGFSISGDDLQRLSDSSGAHQNCFVTMVCGGDGICAINLKDALTLLDHQPGWLSIKRSSNKAYGVSGPAGTLKHKVPMNRWPAIVFQFQTEETQ